MKEKLKKTHSYQCCRGRNMTVHICLHLWKIQGQKMSGSFKTSLGLKRLFPCDKRASDGSGTILYMCTMGQIQAQNPSALGLHLEMTLHLGQRISRCLLDLNKGVHDSLKSVCSSFCTHVEKKNKCVQSEIWLTSLFCNNRWVVIFPNIPCLGQHQFV